MTALTAARAAEPPTDPAARYWSIAGIYHGVGLGVAFAISCGAYLLLEALRRGRWRRPLGAAQFGLSLVGALMILTPSLAVRRAPWRPDPVTAFHIANLVSAAGYLLVLLGLGIFLVVVADAFRREPEVV